VILFEPARYPVAYVPIADIEQHVLALLLERASELPSPTIVSGSPILTR